MKKRVKNILLEVEKVLKNIPEITHLGNPILRQKCKQVTQKESNQIANVLIKKLDDYRKLSGIGAGLAAPQIGISKEIFVTTGKKGYEVYINPEILSYSKETKFYRESCLSSRVMWGEVERPDSIELKWLDLSNSEHIEKFTGFKARLLQHEFDHLQGICCLDKAISGTVEYSGDVKGEKLRNESLVNLTEKI